MSRTGLPSRSARDAAGTCARCGEEPRIPGRALGPACAEHHRAQRREYRAKARAAGMCPVCTVRPGRGLDEHYADGRFTTCETCAERHRQYLASIRARPGTCSACASPASPGKAKCERCRARDAARRIAESLSRACRRCDKRPLPHSTLCEDHAPTRHVTCACGRPVEGRVNAVTCQRRECLRAARNPGGGARTRWAGHVRTRDRVLDAVRRGFMVDAEVLAVACESTPSTVKATLANLRREGLIPPVRRGRQPR